MSTGSDEPHGCLARDQLRRLRPEPRNRSARKWSSAAQGRKQALVERFERAKAEGDLPAHVDAEGLTRVLIAILQGISVQANQGASREELEQLVDTALMLWPSA